MKSRFLWAAAMIVLPLPAAMVLGADTIALSPARLPGFAALLAQQPAIAAPAGWKALSEAEAWTALSRAGDAGRQGARWAYARSLIAQRRGAEAHGVLSVMQQDDPDLAMVAAFRLARGAAYVLTGRPSDALDVLGGNGLADNPEGCAWRMRALAEAGYAAQALGEGRCALPAVNARGGRARLPFVLAAARAAIETGQPDDALGWLAGVSDRDMQADIYRARAYLALGRPEEARARLDRAGQRGSMTERMDAQLTGIELGLATHALAPAAALKQLADLRFIWRGDHIEERALRLSYRLSGEAKDSGGALATGAILFRFFDPAAQGPGFVSGLQAHLTAVLNASNTLPLDQAAGIFWDHRDLMPSGAEGDKLASSLGARLQEAGLYDRAAELFEHLLFVRAQDLARGPLSVRVASLHILAGHSDRALSALNRTAQDGYTDEMIHARKRVEAAALSQAGKIPEAFAVLQEVPDAGALRAEILWNKRDWSGLIAETGHALPSGGALSDVDQAIILRHAIALAMLGHEDALAALHSRYAAVFARLPTAPVFEMLTASADTVNPGAIARAMASLPTASPAGEMAALFDVARK
ncbi:tetratricopeptide repeat protein [Sphingobium boeckii]|uniref:Tetratricopeptide (TPR) repeat protein n=1 Tax=Sphingobium boeckii TaxID=1082345 RepID=A0A7W9AGY1_9SPHN|nr:tetratricopeptide repeat protein [Sphingobium boeckii]MBB5685254.1 tetratricopeptide (TPR) repeat protein [Sphingobium boeckii]